MKKRKRMAAFALAAAMVFSALPVNTLAVEKQDRDTGGLCIHHTKHTADCGYTPAADGAPCGHQHTGDCYTPVIRCTHVQKGERTARLPHPDRIRLNRPNAATSARRKAAV